MGQGLIGSKDFGIHGASQCPQLFLEYTSHSHPIRVKKELPSKCAAAKAMHKTHPLTISADVKEKDLSGYKAQFLPAFVMRY